MEGDERLRLFVGLPLPADLRERLALWTRTAFADPRGARVVPPGNLHLTLAFLGSRPHTDVKRIVSELQGAARAARRPHLRAVRYRETRSVGMVVFEDEGGAATALSSEVARRLEALGVYTPERRQWLPHVTVLRFRTPPRLRADAPDLGEVSPSELALYHSVLRRAGAQYEIRESVPLGG